MSRERPAARLPLPASRTMLLSSNPVGLLDSNIVLDAGNGNRAVGRCTLDLANGLALCLFFDGTGTLAGFNARIDGAPGVAPGHVLPLEWEI